MRIAVRSLLFAVCATWPAFAGPCTGAEAQLAQVSKALTVNALDVAENSLRTLIASYPDCSEVVLHQARLAQAKGNISGAAELYYRYTDTVIKEIELKWPSGTVQVLRNVKADQVLPVTEE